MHMLKSALLMFGLFGCLAQAGPKSTHATVEKLKLAFFLTCWPNAEVWLCSRHDTMEILHCLLLNMLGIAEVLGFFVGLVQK